MQRKKLQRESEKSIKDIMPYFEIITINCNYKLLNGKEKDKICRFCNIDYKHTKFRKKAHSISESIGNKKVFTLDECDYCNEFF